MTPREGTGRFQWNMAAWFGSQIGSTIWLLLSALVVLRESSFLSVVLLLCFAVPNLAGWVLWSRRDRFAPYPALQGLIALIGVASIAAILITDSLGQLALLDPRLGNSRHLWYGMFLMFPGIILLFHFQETAARRRAHTSPGPAAPRGSG